MLVSDVINSASIALAATENASNQIPYLGLQWFPEEKKAGLDLKWIKTHKGLPVSLAPSNFDALPVIRARGGLKTEKTQMAFFRESMIITEEDAQEIDRINDVNDPYLAGALTSIYDDTNNLVNGAEVVPERMRMQLLATTEGHPTIGIESDGVKYAYDYDPTGEYASKHYMKLSGTAMWSDTKNSKPITDIITARKALEKLGKTARYFILTSTTWGYLLENEQVKSAILAQNPTANIFLDDETVTSIIERKTKLTPIIYDKMFTDESGNEQQFYPDDKITLLPEGQVGRTWFGTTPEERTASQLANVDVTIYKTGIAVAVKTDYGPPALTSTTASEITLPSYEGMDSTYVIEVASS
jgi:hypothetical protein